MERENVIADLQDAASRRRLSCLLQMPTTGMAYSITVDIDDGQVSYRTTTEYYFTQSMLEIGKTEKKPLMKVSLYFSILPPTAKHDIEMGKTTA